MATRPHTCLLLAAAALIVMLAGAPAIADDAQTRWDTEEVRRLAQRYEENERHAQELEEEIEKLEDRGDYGARRDRLVDELSQIPSYTEADNQLGDARLAAIEAAPLPADNDPEAKAAALRAKAASLDSLASWASSSEIDSSSRLYSVFGDGGEASSLARTYRHEAGVLEVKANAEEVAEQEKEAAEEAAKEAESLQQPKENPDAGAGGAGDGGEEPVEEEPVEPAPEATPVETGTGFLGGTVNPVPILVFLALAAGCVFALSRSAGTSVGQYFSLGALMARHKKKSAPKKRPKTKQPEKTKAAAGTSTPERRTKRPRTEPADLEDPEAHDEPNPSADELQRMFDLDEKPRPKPDGDDDDDDDLPDFDARL